MFSFLKQKQNKTKQNKQTKKKQTNKQTSKQKQNKTKNKKTTTRGAVPYSGHYLTIAAGISSSSFVRVSTRQLAVSSLSKGILSSLNFHESIGTDGTRTRNLSHLKASAVSIELIWL